MHIANIREVSRESILYDAASVVALCFIPTSKSSSFVKLDRELLMWPRCISRSLHYLWIEALEVLQGSLLDYRYLSI